VTTTPADGATAIRAGDTAGGAIALADAADAIYRFAAGQDLGDRDIYASVFTEDAVLDFSQPANLFGADAPPMVGAETILAHAFTATRDLVTTHTVTNVRWAKSSIGPPDDPPKEGQSVHALVEAQHVDPADPARRFLLKNNYFVYVVPAADVPSTTGAGVGARIQRMIIETLWSAGDPAVLFGENQ
jgi:hypothetical protein